MKRLLLVTSPPACGKTYISKKLAENLKHVVYLDKDSLIVLSKQIFVVAREEYTEVLPFSKNTSVIMNMTRSSLLRWKLWNMMISY